MEPWLSSGHGNPSSLHAEGREAKAAIDSAREILSSALGSLFAEVLFTSSGTEAANLAIIGAALKNDDSSRNRILLGAAEHHCVLHTESILRRIGYRVDLIPVDREARVAPTALQSMLRPDVLLVSVMHANNEFGTVNPIPELASLAHDAGALMHSDTVQSFLAGIDVAGNDGAWQVGDLDVDLVSLSAHKLGGPKGIGALWMRAGVKLQPLAVGGGQEREMRAGTENVAAIAGFGAAVKARQAEGRSDLRSARDQFMDSLVANGFVRTLNPATPALPGHAHVRLPGVDAETMLIRLDREGISASSGAACSSGSLEPSHVLLACGYSPQGAREGLRFSFGRGATPELAEIAAKQVTQAARQVLSQRG